MIISCSWSNKSRQSQFEYEHIQTHHGVSSSNSAHNQDDHSLFHISSLCIFYAQMLEAPFQTTWKLQIFTNKRGKRRKSNNDFMQQTKIQMHITQFKESWKSVVTWWKNKKNGENIEKAQSSHLYPAPSSALWMKIFCVFPLQILPTFKMWFGFFPSIVHASRKWQGVWSLA